MKQHIKNNLEQDGIVLIPNIVDDVTCKKASHEIEIILQSNDEDLLFTKNNVARKICYAFDKNEVFLEILSSPAVIGILYEIYGSKIGLILPTWEDILIKCPLNGIPVEVHQDLGLPSLNGSNVFSLAIYLTDSKENPVNYLKGSNKLGPLNREQIKNYYDLNLFTPYSAQKGDITVHNVLTIHYSEPNTSSHPRYTWYIEFRTIDQVVNDSPWNLDWAMKRQAILAYAIEWRKARGLDFLGIDFNNYSELIKYVANIELRVPHISNGIEYTDNEYNHFNDHKTLF